MVIAQVRPRQALISTSVTGMQMHAWLVRCVFCMSRLVIAQVRPRQALISTSVTSMPMHAWLVRCVFCMSRLLSRLLCGFTGFATVTHVRLHVISCVSRLHWLCDDLMMNKSCICMHHTHSHTYHMHPAHMIQSHMSHTPLTHARTVRRLVCGCRCEVPGVGPSAFSY